MGPLLFTSSGYSRAQSLKFQDSIGKFDCERNLTFGKPSRLSVLRSRRNPLSNMGSKAPPRLIRTKAAAVAPAEEPRKESMFRPFKDPTSNSRLLALCFAQALCSVATLIHDTYLPVYLSDVLKLSNTKARTYFPLLHVSFMQWV